MTANAAHRVRELERRAAQHRAYSEQSQHYPTKQKHLGIAIGLSRAAELEAQRLAINERLGRDDLPDDPRNIALATLSFDGDRRRRVVEPAAGCRHDYWLVDERWDALADRWRPVGREPLADATLRRVER